MPKQEVDTCETLTDIQEKIESLQKPEREVNRDAQSSTVLHPQLGTSSLPATQLLAFLCPTALLKINNS